MGESKTIVQQLEDIAGEICDKYCKYPERFTLEDEDKLYEICYKCPLGKL